MKRVIALFLSAILLVSLSVPALAAEPQQSNRIHAALDTPEFKSAYKDLQVVNEIIEVLQTKVNRKNEKSPAKFTRPKMGITKQAGEKSHRQPG